MKVKVESEFGTFIQDTGGISLTDYCLNIVRFGFWADLNHSTWISPGAIYRVSSIPE